MLIRKSLNPYVTSRFNTVQIVMLDVIIALSPLVYVAWLAYGKVALQVIGVAIVTAILTEFVFSFFLLEKKSTVLDGSAIVTALLLAFTLPPAIPLYVVAFGSFSAILFGKILWGGLGKNYFNPALVGREFMSVFFISIMSSSNIWKTQDLVNIPSLDFFNSAENSFYSDYFIQILFKTNGALGEYSIIAITLGGIYLLFRNRISWHIPLSLLSGFIFLLWLGDFDTVKFSIGGILLGTVFMATDMPSSPVTKYGKIYYGLMIGIAIYIFIIGGCSNEYMSYAILTMNGFSNQISILFKPVVFGSKIDKIKKLEEIIKLTLRILIVVCAIILLHYYELIFYVIYLYLIYIIYRFNHIFSKQINNIF
ncbi:hypothetical protein AV926_18420 [Myroides marinus]|uniref:Electron transport complex protein RnfD n=1 Tax=Myroides marinus TaxID=703342 RepID=A0A165Q1Q2_9FLAO|nr:RnfABCDGE type electron transport complex subunit D [Myroides marinus]KZE73359.1 hypothetical protein AV926_18420 [Myroides marinus]